MNILILSCDTGGGHNSAGQAIQEELLERGHHVVMTDPFRLSSHRLAGIIGGAYVKLVQKHPKIFGLIYYLGMLVTKLPFRSPVYYANGMMAAHMQDYLRENSYDVIVMPHLYPAEILTYLKHKGVSCPKTIFIATDYTCIPFTEETDCDYYITPHPSLSHEFIRRGMHPEKLYPFGIPVRHAFVNTVTREAARRNLNLPEDNTYFLVMGGSIGAGNLKKLVKYLADDLQTDEHLIVICGNNASLQRTLSHAYRSVSHISILGKTDKIADYMRACDLVYSKPGGLSSTEAAVIGVPLVHTTPIPGCESRNRHFFHKHGMSVSSDSVKEQAALGRALFASPKKTRYMLAQQAKFTFPSAAKECCDFIEKVGPA